MMWRENWDKVRTEEPTLERLRLSLIWGICHVHARVEEAEITFTEYVETGEITSPMLLERRKRAIASVNDWLYSERFEFDTWCALPYDAKLLTVMFNVYGLNAVKASFALTSGGFADIACLDSHIYSYRLNKSAPRFAGCTRDATRCLSNLKRYLDDVLSAYGRIVGSGFMQWVDYENLVDAFAEDGHATYFRALRLGQQEVSTY
jgi:hypothetical protein